MPIQAVTCPRHGSGPLRGGVRPRPLSESRIPGRALGCSRRNLGLGPAGPRRITTDVRATVAEAGTGGGSRGGGGGSSDGGGGGGGRDGGDDADVPDDIRSAVATGLVSSKVIDDFRKIAAIPLVGGIMAGIPGLRNRILADPRFIYKTCTECAVDMLCATGAEVAMRGEDFWKEFEFYLSDMVLHMVLDITIVYTMSRRLMTRAPAEGLGLLGKFSTWKGRLPGSFFEKAAGGANFTFADRSACLAVRAVEWAGVGLAAGYAGQLLTNIIVGLRKAVDKSYNPQVGEMPDVLQTGLVVALFMGTSANLRYNLIGGAERFLETSFAHRPLIPSLGTIAVRWGNNVFSGAQFVDWQRRFGGQGTTQASA